MGYYACKQHGLLFKYGFLAYGTHNEKAPTGFVSNGIDPFSKSINMLYVYEIKVTSL